MQSCVIVLHTSVTDIAARLHDSVRSCAVQALVVDNDWLAIPIARPRLIVWELSRAMPNGLLPVPDHVVHACEGTALLLRIELRAGTAREVARIIRGGYDVTVSLCGVDDLCRDIARLLDEGTGDAVSAVIRRVVPTVPLRARDVMLSLAIAGRRRTSVVALADLCRLPTRTLEWQLRAGGLPTARTLLGWMLAVHTAWRMDILGWPLKRAANEAGFPESERLGNYIVRHVGVRPKQLAREGFQATLDRFAMLVAMPNPNAGASPPVVAPGS